MRSCVDQSLAYFGQFYKDGQRGQRYKWYPANSRWYRLHISLSRDICARVNRTLQQSERAGILELKWGFEFITPNLLI